MPTPPLLGLIASGPLNPTLADVPRVCSWLGPVIAPRLTLASRYANRLGGTPTAHWPDLNACSLIIVNAPDGEVPGLLENALRQGLVVRKKTLLLWDTESDCALLERPAHFGAECVSTCVLWPRGKNVILIEGSPLGVASTRRILEGADHSPISLPPRTKPNAIQALHQFATGLKTQLVSVNHDLRGIGLRQSEITMLANEVLAGAARSTRKVNSQSAIVPTNGSGASPKQKATHIP